MKSTTAFARAEDVGVIVDDLVFVFFEAFEDFFSFGHTDFAAQGTGGLHTQYSVTLPENFGFHDFFHFRTDLVVGCAFSALLSEMFGKGIGFFVASTSGPILTVFGSACFDYLPNVRYMLTSAFFLV